MKQLFLANLAEWTNEKVLNHLATEYAGTPSENYTYGETTEQDIKEAAELLKDKTVLIAYESDYDYGATSFFLLQDQQGKLYEVHGSHCSCFGFEGQLDLEETTMKALKFRLENDGVLFYCDEDDNEDHEAVKNYIFEFQE
jgi:hypothetical protein